MASRQNQGLQIALIFFVMMTILLSVVVYFTATSASEYADKYAKEQERARSVEAQRNAADTLSKLLMAWVGDGELTEDQWKQQYDQLSGNSDQAVSTWVAAAQRYRGYYDQDMFNFGVDYSDPKGWRTLPQYLLTTIKQKNNELVANNNQINQMKADFAAGLDAAKEQVRVAEEARLAAETAKTQVEQAARAVEATLRTEQQNAQALAATARQEQEADRVTLNTSVDVATDLATAREESVQALAARVDEYERDEFDIADGEVEWVNARLGIVYINLGSADNLPRTQVFTVYGQDDATFNPTGKKGTIRILRIRDAHSAEAEILEQDLKNPILANDKIFTPTWKPGRTLKFALSGFLDFDGNGTFEQIDIDALSTLIRENGGEVVASIDPQTGTLSNDIDALTNFVITGGDPTNGDPTTIKAIGDASKTLRDQAVEAGVQLIDMNELLEQYGYRNSIGIERTGPGVEGFVPRRPPGRSADGTSF